MPSGDYFDEAINRFRTLIKSHPAKQLQGANEAKTRLLVIDEVLAILGWAKTEYEPEQATSVGSYTDYRLTLDGQPCLIVEAKRIGVVAPLPKTIQRPEYANSFLFTNYGYEMKSLLEQCQGYCVQCGIPYALATTGEVWIILVGSRACRSTPKHRPTSRKTNYSGLFQPIYGRHNSSRSGKDVGAMLR